MKVFAVLVCFLFALATSQATASSIQLDVNPGSNPWFIAIAVRDASVATQSVQIQQASSSTWESMNFVTGWGFYTFTSTSDKLNFPISVRLNSEAGHQLTLPNILSSESAGSVDTGVQFTSGTIAPPTEDPSCPATPPPTQAPTDAPTEAPTDAPTEAPTEAPTDAPTDAPTEAPTDAPTEAPTDAPTDAPTEAPTDAPTEAPTQEATRRPRPGRPTNAPTSAPSTKAPTTKAPTTKAPTSAPSTKAPTTKSPTSAPSTKAPTTKAPSTTAPTTTKPTSSGGSGCSGPMKFMVPLYTYPGATWDTVAASGGVVPTVAIINPNSGPGNGPDSTFSSYMPKLHNAGVEMVGYVHTSYGARAISDVKKEIDVYAQQFPLVVGIFLDEVSASKSQLSYYQELYSYIMGMPGWKYDILNPGAVPDAGYVNAATQIVTYESSASGFANSQNPSYATCETKDKFAMITYGGSSSTMQSAISAAKSKGYYGWVYVTDTGATGATYNSLPSFYTAEANYIASLN